jgi:hypothetical protein
MCYQTHRFEYNLLPPYSCEGELEFSRGTPFGRPASAGDPELIMGNLSAPVPGAALLEDMGGSMGEVAAVEEPERGWLLALPSWGMRLRSR